VKAAGETALKGSVESGSAWIRGNVYLPGGSGPEFSKGSMVKVSRPKPLVNGTGFYYTVSPPTYAEYGPSRVVNIKQIDKYPVAGDGAKDDTANIQAILNDAAAAGKVVYFPHGIYLLSDTLTIPPGSRLVGEVWSQLSASGSKFADPKSPRPMVKVGNPGDVGVAQMSDFLFTVAADLPGAVLVEVNMAGSKPGDVGFFNSHFRVGGARGSKLFGACSRPETCLGARLNAHLTPSSSSYWENSWAWTADHNLDGEGNTYPGTGGGFLIEARNGTWMLGIGIGEWPGGLQPKAEWLGN
jgi:glucan 1,3-beta-glucosidase